jgi:hypothetical protein
MVVVEDLDLRRELADSGVLTGRRAFFTGVDSLSALVSKINQ